MLDESQLKHYDKNGFLVLSKFFHKSEVAEVLGYSLSVLGNGLESNIFKTWKENPDKIKNLGKLLQYSEPIQRLGFDKKIRKLCKELGLKKPIQCTRPVQFFHHKDLAEKEIYYKTPPHQDWASIRGSLNGLVIWLPLVDCSYAAIGPLEIVPKSHKKGSLAVEVKNNFGLVKCYKSKDFYSLLVKPGDIVVFNQFLVHRSGKNTSNQIRWSINYRFADLADPQWAARDFYTPYKYYPDTTGEDIAYPIKS